MTLEERETIKFILNTSRTEIDLRWKLGKFVKNGDVSFLGKNVSKLNERIRKVKSEFEKKNKLSAKVSK